MEDFETTPILKDEPILPKEVGKRKFSLITFFVITLVLVVIFSFLRYFVFKNYDFTLEVSCDPVTETCFHRDCEAEECPPNNLEDYKKFAIKAFQFDKCEGNNLCKDFCEKGKQCIETVCDTNTGDICSGPTSKAQ